MLVVGNAGSGKSVLARSIGVTYQLPVVHLDRLYWQPGWVAPESEAWTARVTELAAKECWVIDGNYQKTLLLRLARAELVIYLDMPRWLCLWRVLCRHGKKRPDLQEVLEEKFDRELLRFLWQVWCFPKERGKRLWAMLENSGVMVVRLRSRRQVRAFLAALQQS